jgi:hypothetical protein
VTFILSDSKKFKKKKKQLKLEYKFKQYPTGFEPATLIYFHINKQSYLLCYTVKGRLHHIKCNLYNLNVIIYLVNHLQ